MNKIERALISLTDKSGIEGFAKDLAELDIELLSTGGTAKKLRDSGLTVMDVSEFTGFPRVILFSSGYMANLGVVTALSQPEQKILIDADAHA